MQATEKIAITNNTIVTASDANYGWGVFLLIASARLNSMREPIIVYAQGYNDRQLAAIKQFDNVQVLTHIDGIDNVSLTKPDLILASKTEYATWVDCDGFFTDYCSDLLTPDTPDQIHVRSRSAKELALLKFAYSPSASLKISPALLETWRKDVGEGNTPNIDTFVVPNFLSVNKKYFDFIRRWKSQMAIVLNQSVKGVLDENNTAYKMMDESVLNSLLFFMNDCPQVSKIFKLSENPQRRYLHMPLSPKPWIRWNKYNMRYFDRYISLVERVLDKGLELPAPLPYTLMRCNRTKCNILAQAMPFIEMPKRVVKKFKNTILP